MQAMAPRSTSVLGPLHPDLRTNITFKPSELVPSWQEFIVPATDRHGHSKPEALAMPPGMQAEIENIVSSRVFPYRRTGEVWRHAMMRHLAWIRKLEPKMKSSYYGALLAEQEILREELFKQQTEQTFKFQEERLGMLLERGDEDEACMLAFRLYEQMEHLPHTSWKQRFQKRFNRQYAGLVEDGRKLLEIALHQESMVALPEPEPLALLPSFDIDPLPLPYVPAFDYAPILANQGQPLVDFQLPVVVAEFTGPSPAEIVGVMYGLPLVFDEEDDNTLEPQIIACVDWDGCEGDGWVEVA